MQAMKVSPIDKNGKANTIEIVIIYAKNRATNLQTIILDDKMFEQSLAYPYSDYKIDSQVQTP